MPRAPVVVIGDALIDEIRDASGRRELVGGAGLNVAVGLRRLGVPSTLVAMVGFDEAGSRIRTYLADHDVGLLATHAPLGSARAVVTHTGAEPRYSFNAAARGRSIRFSSAVLDASASAPRVVVSGFPFDDSAEVAALRDAVGATSLAIDANPRAGLLRDAGLFARELLSFAPGNVVKLAADDVALLGDGLDVWRSRLRAVGASAVLATQGAAGGALDVGELTVRSSAPPLPGRVIDTIGAGDAAFSALIAGILADAPSGAASWQGVLERAMAVAAATCRGEGGLLRTPESCTHPEGGS